MVLMKIKNGKLGHILVAETTRIVTRPPRFMSDEISDAIISFLLSDVANICVLYLILVSGG